MARQARTLQGDYHAPSPLLGGPAAPPAPAVHHSARLPGWPGLGTVAPPGPSSSPGRRLLIGLPPPLPGSSPPLSPMGIATWSKNSPEGTEGLCNHQHPPGGGNGRGGGAERGGDTEWGEEEAGGGAKVLERKLLKGTGNLSGKRGCSSRAAGAAHVAGCPRPPLRSWPTPPARGPG